MLMLPVLSQCEVKKEHLFEVGGFLIIRHVKYFGFHDAAEGDDGLAPMLLHPLEDLQHATHV